MIAAGLVSGCGLTSNGPHAAGKKERAPFAESVVTAGALVTRYSQGETRRRMWSIRWKSADLTFAEGGDFEGEMRDVEGSLFSGGDEASRFKAALGVANKRSSMLKLSGGVRVESSAFRARLFCDAIRWDPEREVIEATGNVRLETKDGTLGPFERLWLSPELRVATTPDLFEEDHARGR